MIELKNINKSFLMGDKNQQVLKNINLSFRQKEFVSILGTSGSGKTTLLNIIGGLDKSDSGELIISNCSTKKFKDHDWDIYRNHHIGFIFQNYNLIMHQSVLQNVELALTLSGTSKKERRKKAKRALIKVGLKEQLNKKPNQLSGGQMQRVAIARALVNNPDIILADEPTGALDSKTSKQVMELLKEISKTKLVIMVTHNSDLARKYSTRIIELKDGNIISDSNPYNKQEDLINIKDKSRTKMSLLTSLSLSLNNLSTKKGCTFLTSLASSVGIIGIALILSLSNGVNKYTANLERDSLSDFPIAIEENSYDLLSTFTSSFKENNNCSKDKLCPIDFVDPNKGILIKNDLKSFKKYLSKNEEINTLTDRITYHYDIELNVYNDNQIIDSSHFEQLEKVYPVLKGRLPKYYNEIVLAVNSEKTISKSLLSSLNIPLEENYDYEIFLNKTYKLIVDTTNQIDLTIVGIVEDKNTTNSYLGYNASLVEYIIQENNYDIDNPSSINIYPKDYNSKEKIISLIKEYNKENPDKEIYFTDLLKSVLDSVIKIVNIISYILIALVAISLIVSSIMIAIITYISVLERTKEIGILRSLGASKKDIIRIFKAETLIEGFIAGILGVGIAYLLTFPINIIVNNIIQIKTIAVLPKESCLLIILSISLNILAGTIPSRIAANKEPVEALRTE